MFVVIKESSDELNPPPSTRQREIVRAHSAKSLSDYLALVIATCGVGYLPLAPGTWGSLVGIVLYAGLRAVFLSIIGPGRLRFDLAQTAYTFVVFDLIVVAGITFAGTWAASRTEKLSGKKDPGKVVIDEVAGQMLALAPVPLVLGSWWTIGVAFVAFRFFDIVKPYPARPLESLKAGLGIMADDIVAGAYAGLVVGVLVVIRSFS